MEFVQSLKDKKLALTLSSIFIFLIICPTAFASTLAISDAQIRSSYFGFDKAWVVSFISDDYTTDSLTAYLTPSDFKSASGTETQQSLNIDVNTKPNSCTYSFKIGTFKYADVYTVEPIEIKKWVFTKTDLNELKDMIRSQCADFSKPGYNVEIQNLNSDGTTWTAGDYVYGDYAWMFQAKIYCVKLNEKIGTIAQPIDKRIIAESDWKVQASGKSAETKTISNSEAGSGRSTKIGNNVYVQWQGNLGTGEDCPDVSNLIGVHDNSFSGGWRLASRNKYNTYNSYLTNGIKLDIKNYGETSNKDYFQSLFRTNSNKIIRDVTTEEAGFSYSVLDSSVLSGKIKIDLGRQIVFPLFRLIIDADYLEINIPVGKPQIYSVSDVEFTEGLAGQLEAVVKNVGSEKGGFTARVMDCDSGFSSSTSPAGVTLNPGESQTLQFNIIGSTTAEAGKVSGRCTLELKESTSGETATRSFSITMTQLLQCDPLSKACGFNEAGQDVIKQCNTAGTKYDIIEICRENEECVLTLSGAICREKGIYTDFGECEGCWGWLRSKVQPGYCKPTLTQGLTCFFFMLKLGFVILLTIVSGLLSYDLLRKNFSLTKKNELLSGILALVIAGVIGYVAYLTLWIGVVVFVIVYSVGKFTKSIDYI